MISMREKQTYQEHFIDLCRLVDHPTPNEADPTGTRFAFERGADKTSGGHGWADVAKLGYFGWEYKGKDHDLDKAYEQLLRYRDALRNPPLLIVSDINQIVIRTNYTNLPTRTFTVRLEDMLRPESIQILKTVFTDPEQLKPHETVESVTQAAASRLADNLRRYGNGDQEIAHFLIRLLFCLFAEDIGLLPERLFPRLLEHTRRNSKDFAEVLRQLFRAMNTGGYFGADRILHFDGGLFDDDSVLPLDSADIDELDWGAIQPLIFGTLFKRGLDPGKRSQLSAQRRSPHAPTSPNFRPLPLQPPPRRFLLFNVGLHLSPYVVYSDDKLCNSSRTTRRRITSKGSFCCCMYARSASFIMV